MYQGTDTALDSVCVCVGGGPLCLGASSKEQTCETRID